MKTPQRLSHLSVNFRVPSGFIGNIGEPLDHGQSGSLFDVDEEDAGEAHQLADIESTTREQTSQIDNE